MKAYAGKIIAFSALFMALAFAASSQVIVKVRPNPPVIVRPVAPSPRHVWIDGGWVVRGGKYTWVEGYWTEPRAGMIWVTGHWRHRRGGWVWVPGHWVRR